MKDKSILVWDLPTRLFHWLLVISVIGLWITGKQSDMEVHVIFAYFTLGLLLFRLLWGFLGSHYSLFHNFKLSFNSLRQYLSKQSELNYPGHNPLGSWSVVILLGCLFIQVTTGLFSNDSVLFDGPLRSLVSYEMSDWLTSVHGLNFNILLGLICIHILAVFIHVFVKHEDLLTGILTGKRTKVEAIEGQFLRYATLKHFFIATVISCGLVALIVNLGFF